MKKMEAPGTICKFQNKLNFIIIMQSFDRIANRQKTQS
jgi:hypothetical protein